MSEINFVHKPGCPSPWMCNCYPVNLEPPPPRYVWDITVTRYEAEPGSPWLVNELDPLTDRPC